MTERWVDQVQLAIWEVARFLQVENVYESQTFPSLGTLNPVSEQKDETTISGSQEADTLQVVINPQTPQQVDCSNNSILGSSQTTPFPSHEINPSVHGHGSDESDNNGAEKEMEETKGAGNDAGAAALEKEGTDQLDVEEECVFVGLIPYLENDDFEDLIKWCDEQFFSYPDPTVLILCD
ncbi:OLC1v1037000C1 [Oldenlandia corymbosa var. corymbosa]|uniref:OLC1v1037000C1 n=1 Tax=Oldenlandia corymbosa var. corymbosa TaxID=529605 RepID=A0AAV1CWQ6_OLDCO|nr:OLC1v1037000C1 [Oldenlandia corymbosa var. corymbosa]